MRFLSILVPLALAADVMLAQQPTDLPPEKGGTVYSLGMPPVYKGHAGAMVGWDRPGSAGEVSGLGHLGVMKDLGSPIVGIMALGLEGYAGYRADKFDWGGRALFSVPVMHFTTGADYNGLENRFDWLIRLELPMRRGGIFGRGTQIRFDYLPTRGHSFGVGINSPLWGRNIGQTRPKTDNVRFRSPPLTRLEQGDYELPDGVEETIANVRASAFWIARLAMPLDDRKGGDPHEVFAETTSELGERLKTRGFNDEIAFYHAELDRAFSMAVSGGPLSQGRSTAEGREASAAARRVLLDEVLLPYNRLLGQRKTAEGLDQFRAIGHSEFARWIYSESGLAEAHYRATFYVFQQLVDIADEIRASERERWRESRLVWLPLQLALTPDQHDTQEELDAIIERAVQAQFTEGNDVWYVMNEEFQFEMARSVLRAEDYHVLWIHDYRGKNGEGNPDRLAFGHAVNYMRALTQRVGAYDEVGKLPLYMIMLDQHYFEVNKGRMFLRLLSDPLNATLSLPDGYEDWETQWRAAQDSLRMAVENSRLLRIERSQFGDDWLENRIKVHVNITNPSDFSFQSFHMAGIIPIPDNMIRDHRKIAFYDITDQDPYKGLSMYTGMGIGEHYVGANWEDRAVMLRGPAALAVRDAAYRLLLNQGFTEEEIPLPLRPHEKPDGYNARVAQEAAALQQEWGAPLGRVMELHNETGYADKPINVEKAILYTLMPKGSVLRVPDSLWQSYLYGSMLAGSALRGCHVLVIAPSLETAPSSAPPTMARAHGLLSALVYFRNQLDEMIRSTGGLLKIGLYSPRVGVGDLRGRIMQARATYHDALEEIDAPDPEVEAVFDSLDLYLAEVGYGTEYLVESDTTQRPKLHLKANVFLSGEAWDVLDARPGWGIVAKEYIQYLARQTGPAAQRGDARDIPPELEDALKRFIAGTVRDTDPERLQRAIVYMTVGSTNMNYRSMVMDGEVQILATSWLTIGSLMDFYIIEGLTEWIDTLERLDELLPPPGGMTKWMANLLRLAL